MDVTMTNFSIQLLPIISVVSQRGADLDSLKSMGGGKGITKIFGSEKEAKYLYNIGKEVYKMNYALLQAFLFSNVMNKFYEEIGLIRGRFFILSYDKVNNKILLKYPHNEHYEDSIKFPLVTEFGMSKFFPDGKEKDRERDRESLLMELLKNVVKIKQEKNTNFPPSWKEYLSDIIKPKNPFYPKSLMLTRVVYYMKQHPDYNDLIKKPNKSPELLMHSISGDFFSLSLLALGEKIDVKKCFEINSKEEKENDYWYQDMNRKELPENQKVFFEIYEKYNINEKVKILMFPIGESAKKISNIYNKKKDLNGSCFFIGHFFNLENDTKEKIQACKIVFNAIGGVINFIAANLKEAEKDYGIARYI